MKSLKEILEEYSVSDIVEALGISAVLSEIPIDEAISYYDTDNVLDEIGMSTCVDHWRTDDVYEHIDGYEYTFDHYWGSAFDRMYDSCVESYRDSIYISDDYEVDDAISKWGITRLVNNCDEPLDAFKASLGMLDQDDDFQDVFDVVLSWSPQFTVASYLHLLQEVSQDENIVA